VCGFYHLFVRNSSFTNLIDFPMAEPFLSEIRIMSFVFAPKGWALCNGQLLPINQNQGLFSLLGTTFGGDGRVNFGLPDLRGRAPIHVGSGHTLGERAGEQAHTLSIAELPQHLHTIKIVNSKGNPSSDNLISLANSGDERRSATIENSSNWGVMDLNTITNTGGSQAHLNMQPFLTLSFCIALQGIFPSAT
jgi:microcystin-dependent protein